MAPLLFDAVSANNLAAVRSTVKAGADVSVRDDQGRSPLDLALEKGHFEVARFLLQARTSQQRREIEAAAAAPPAPDPGPDNEPSIPDPQTAEPTTIDPAIADPFVPVSTASPDARPPRRVTDGPDENISARELASAIEKLAAVADRLICTAEIAGSKNIRLELVPGDQTTSATARSARPPPAEPATRPARTAPPPATRSAAKQVPPAEGTLAPAPAARPVPPVTASKTPEVQPRTSGDNAATIAAGPAPEGFRPQPKRKPAAGDLGLAALAASQETSSSAQTLEVVLDDGADQIPAEQESPMEFTEPVKEAKKPELSEQADEAEAPSLAALEPRVSEADLAPAEGSDPPPPPSTDAKVDPESQLQAEMQAKAQKDAEEPVASVGGFFKGLGNLLGISADTTEDEAAESDGPPSAPSLPKGVPSDAAKLDDKPVLPLANIDTDRAPLPPAATRAPPRPADTGTQTARRAPTKEYRPPARARDRGNAMPVQRLRAPLSNVLLTMGESVTTGQPKLQQGVGEPNACVTKRGTTTFCIVPVDWPSHVEPAFSVNTILYQGSRAVARYDQDEAVHFHALFDSDAYEDVVDHLTDKFGDPTDVWRRVIAPFGKPRQPNPTFVWRSRNAKTKQVTVLEVRKYDDARAVFPDTDHGSVRLYLAGGPAMFPAVTALDIMSIDWAARSDHGDPAAAPVANTLRITR